MDGYEINSNKLVTLLYTNGKQTKKEVRGNTPFTISSNNIKSLGVILTKQMRDVYDKKKKKKPQENAEWGLERWLRV